MHRLSDYDRRQLNLMIQQLNSFEEGEIDLFSLQSSLEFLFQAMEYVDNSWEDSFLEEISTLASINAGLTENKQIDINMIIKEAVDNFKKIVNKRLE